ncbi:carnitine O-acetyltransferase CAT2 KNAG_0B03770 [Huiozyma naganishii CBS 8797]|uniref:Carnitine O-acetyltransferase, mitochondrial n=1 Tax=Huiozyma naganishii (strain ATCC MYA-139 / BCRC 22969 / CBS 8797 / KCTC 17520 / NBRC 10181 / NCYC 3082 / Yp74L-3) TaxID=1071383 RepID=J7RH07_HUIN7|nr:hypothetical protein KNAG_0B03770 [Kazachstania naganishii CBS 8797]CCK68818.1 hypothetical protein KNAG_0B03770 [Kazachstania naganishii CBS 8797]
MLQYSSRVSLSVAARLMSSRSLHAAAGSPMFQKFAMDTHNDEHYYAVNANEVYQRSRPTFKGETFKLQKDLPALPVPELEETLSKYLTSVKPYIQNEKQLERQQLLVQDFRDNWGSLLQDRLQAYARGKRNWMAQWWDAQAYLQYNDPVIPYVSYFYNHKPLPATHAEIENDPLLKATAIVTTTSKFVEAIKDESLPAELIRGTPFCMNSFQLMFNGARIPGLPEEQSDGAIFYSAYENNFVVVALRGNFYKMVTHDAEGTPLAPSQIWEQLYTIVNLLDSQLNTAGAGVGALTSLPRDQWRTANVELIKDPSSRESLEIIHRAAYVLCLDLDTKPVTLEEKSRNSWHGDGINRFYDKPVQFFVTGNGKSGFLGEHSKMDGTPTLFLNTFLCQQLVKMDPAQFISQLRQPIVGVAEQPALLPFTLSAPVKNAIAQAKAQFQGVTQEHELKVCHYNRYGKNLIKQFKMSPDAYVQQIIQLAIYKYLGKQLPTYEAASTRKFFKGRTETGRSVTEASAQFVTNWDKPDVPLDTKITLLRNAIKDHAAYLTMAANGQGIDRHFFGLKNVLKEGESVPLFNDPLFNYSANWYVSTSQLSGELFDGYGWSQVNDVGLGLAYMVNKDWLHFNIVHKPAKSGLDAERIALPSSTKPRTRWQTPWWPPSQRTRRNCECQLPLKLHSVGSLSSVTLRNDYISRK